MPNVQKLEQVASGILRQGETIEKKAVGRTIINSEAGNEIVDGFIGATAHHVIVLIYSIFGPKRLENFAYGQVTIPLFSEQNRTLTLIAANEPFFFTDVLGEPNPNDLVKFIREKKSTPKVTFEASDLAVKPK